MVRANGLGRTDIFASGGQQSRKGLCRIILEQNFDPGDWFYRRLGSIYHSCAYHKPLAHMSRCIR